MFLIKKKKPINIWPFVTQKAAQWNSKNRTKWTFVLKPLRSINKKFVRYGEEGLDIDLGFSLTQCSQYHVKNGPIIFDESTETMYTFFDDIASGIRFTHFNMLKTKKCDGSYAFKLTHMGKENPCSQRILSIIWKYKKEVIWKIQKLSENSKYNSVLWL